MNSQRVRRFSRFQIVFHWLLAVPYLVLLGSGTGLVLHRLGLFERMPRTALSSIHRWVGLGLIGILVLVFAGAVILGQLRRVATDVLSPMLLRRRDLLWLLKAPLNVIWPQRFHLPPADRFNGGQRLHSLFIAVVIAGFGITGLMIMARPADLRPWIVHSWLLLGAGLFLLLHVFLGLINPPTRQALSGMFSGFVSRAYMEDHHALMLDGRESHARPHAVVSLRWLVLTLIVAAASAGLLVRSYGLQRLASFSQLSHPAICPGSLAAGHADDPRTAACEACHQGLKAPSDSACLACHAQIARVMAQASGYHGRLKGTCLSCHPDHRGRDADLRGLNTQDFNHRLARFGLEGRHATVACDECHLQHSGKPGHRRFIQLQFGSCLACHSNPHQDAKADACARCHSEQGWSGRHVHFDHQHDTDFHLDGRHARVACIGCHSPRRAETRQPHDGVDRREARLRAIKMMPIRNTACSGAKTAAFLLTGIGYSCADCHIDPHDPSLGSVCQRCHTTRGWTAGDLLFRHDRDAEFRLEGAHVATGCETCHALPAGGTALAQARFAGLPTQCGGCHGDPHAGQFDRECTICHTQTGWTGRQVLFQHDRDSSFPLQGRHAQAACTQCHSLPAADASLGHAAFAGVPHECGKCHAGPHQGQFDKDCSSCHTEQSWRRLLIFDHDRDSRFKIDGTHRHLQCSACHKTSQGVTVYRPLAVSCEECHRSVSQAMAGTIAGKRVAADPHNSRVQCADCHPAQSQSRRQPTAMADSCAKCHNPRYRALYFEWQRSLDERAVRIQARISFTTTSMPKSAEILTRRLAEARTIGMHNVQQTVEMLDRLLTGTDALTRPDTR